MQRETFTLPRLIGCLTPAIIALAWNAGCASEGSSEGPAITRTTRPVIDGEVSPDAFDFSINALEQGAAGAMLYRFGASYGQGCSGTLIGDRLVISAGHCVVANQQQWLNGAAPDMILPEDVDFGIGNDAFAPLCQLKTAEVHLHPDCTATSNRILNDLSVLVLAESVIQECPHVVPLQVNTAWVKEAMEGELLLAGGFGSTDGTYNFSPIRYWSQTQLLYVWTDDLVSVGIGQGDPTFGDSGSGVLYRYSDGSLQVLGTHAAGGIIDETMMHFSVRLDQHKEWLGQLLTSTDACGPVGADGICIGDVAVYCEHQRFSSFDCEAGGSQCFVDGSGLATCGCACDLEPFCEQECDCDPECRCSADCAAAGQECALNPEGIAVCGCPCDLGPTCEAGCDCDMQCPCVCDQTTTCDETCACDPDCDSEPPAEPDGCSQAGGLRSLGSVALPTLLILLILGCGRRARRRRP